jgi:uncharacterized protein (DUF885 family)
MKRLLSTIALLISCACVATGSELRETIERYDADHRAVGHIYSVCPSGRAGGSRRFGGCFDEPSAARLARYRSFYEEWLGRLKGLDFDKLSQEGKIDYLLLDNRLHRELRQLDLEAKRLEETGPFTPFAGTILGLADARRRMEPLDASKAAAAVTALSAQVAAVRKQVQEKHEPQAAAIRAAREVEQLRTILRNWFEFYLGYDPLFTWWVEAPFKNTDKALQDYATFLREKVAGIQPDQLVGDPIGREALLSELASEMIPYTPEELIDIANREAAWCEAELKKAAREMGYGDDWHKALEQVKTRHVEPGKQPALIRDLAREAIEFVQKRNLLTLPPLALEDWRIEMMSPERQLVNPFFTGGDDIDVSYPTNTMSQEQKLMSMRGNNIYFARATVFHELIPGHHLQMFMAERYHPYRWPFATPFYVEGWAVYWEMLLWDLNFDGTPEQRVGALFWRLHRCARIVFSLNFHLGKMLSQDCIDYLVDRVGHERANAAAEVRRSIADDYGPLYQAAYMLGALQLRALRRDLVERGKMSDLQFHDAVLMENSVPIEMIRAALTGQKLARDFRPSWRFYEDGRSR